jgi:hypothetical protein
MEIREHDGHLGTAHADVTSPIFPRVATMFSVGPDTRSGEDRGKVGSVVAGRFVRRTTTQA